MSLCCRVDPSRSHAMSKKPPYHFQHSCTYQDNIMEKLTRCERMLAEERLHAMEMQDKARGLAKMLDEVQRNLQQMNIWVREIMGKEPPDVNSEHS